MKNDNTDISVLIVDDNDMTRTLLRVILRNEEYAVAGEATNGENGLEMAFKLKPDIICLDVEMPKTGGIDVLKKIKEQLPTTMVLMVTGSRDRDTVQAAMAGGASGFILKPFTAGTVLKTIEQTVAKIRSARAAES